MSSIRKSCLSVLMVLLIVLLPGSRAFAQTVTGTISGMVADSSGAVIAGAAVMLINQQTRDERTVNTNDDGRFSFVAIQPGTYTIKVERQDFQTLEQKNVVLSANQTLALGSSSFLPRARSLLLIGKMGRRPSRFGCLRRAI